MSRAKKVGTLLAIAILALATASVAMGKFTKGIYRSKPPASRVNYVDFSFTATKTKAKTVRFYYRKTNACSNGNAAIGTEEVYGNPARAINRAGKFSIHVTNAAGSKLDITGKVRGRKAFGTLRDRFSVGSVHCDTKAMHWTALHLG